MTRDELWAGTEASLETFLKAQEKSIQFLGRLVRSHASKTKAYLDDIHYPGKYLDNHGKSRRRYYQEQGLKVIRITYGDKEDRG